MVFFKNFSNSGPVTSANLMDKGMSRIFQLISSVSYKTGVNWFAKKHPIRDYMYIAS